MSVQTSYSNNMSAAYAGQLIDTIPGGVTTMVNAEASATMVFGRAVAFTPSSTHDKQASIPANADDKIAGILLRSHAYGISPYGDLDQAGGGILPDGQLNVLRQGTVWAVCEDGCSPGDRLWVRRVAAGDPEFLGGLNSADDSTDTIDCTTQGVWLTTAAAGGLAKLQVNFVAKQADAA